MDHNRLNQFLIVAETGSLSRAADRTRLAQPALSRQIRMLEESLGFPLFRRHRRGMQLTDEGEELRNRITGPLRQIELAVEELRSKSSEVGGKIVLGMPPTTGTVLAGSLARRVASHAPNLNLRIVEGYGGHLIDWLQRGEIDIAVVYGPASDYLLSAEEILLEPLMLVGPPGSDLSPGVPVDFADVIAKPLILPSHPHGLRVVVENAARKRQRDLRIKFEADSYHLMKELVEHELGYAILPLSAIARDAEANHLLYAPIENPRLSRQLALATQPGAELPRATRRLAEMIRQEIVAMVEGGLWQANLMFDPAPFR